MTQVYSQNGWPAFHTPDDGKFVRFTAGGRGWWAANADAAVVAAEFINRFNSEVESVVYPDETYDDWSFADRLVRGSTATVSNHGSATAWDVNATRHLLGVDNTFSDADEARLLKIQKSITDDAGRPVLRWGGSYSGRKDEMHIEINATKEQVRQAAAKLRAKEDDVTENELKAAIRAVLQEKLVPNVDGTGKETGRMSLIRADDLGDQKLDFIKAAVKRLESTVAAQNQVLAAIAANSPDAIRAATDEFVAKVRAELAEIDVHVTLGDEAQHKES